MKRYMWPLLKKSSLEMVRIFARFLIRSQAKRYGETLPLFLTDEQPDLWENDEGKVLYW